MRDVVCGITAFCGRHKEVERVIRNYIDQDYKGQSYLLLYNNSPQKKGALRLDDVQLPDYKALILVNNDKDLETNTAYTNTGDIFRDALRFVPKGVDIVTFMDSDDIFLPQHLSAGVHGMKKARNLGCLAYKPYNSYFLWENQCRLMHNTLEPSIFVDYQYVKGEGFHKQPCTYHQKWLDVLSARKQLFVDVEGVPTLMYNWSENHGNHKISGMGDSESNFEAHRKWETSYSPDGILRAASPGIVQYFYSFANKTK
jgi:hypothetical protein